MSSIWLAYIPCISSSTCGREQRRLDKLRTGVRGVGVGHKHLRAKSAKFISKRSDITDHLCCTYCTIDSKISIGFCFLPKRALFNYNVFVIYEQFITKGNFTNKTKGPIFIGEKELLYSGTLFRSPGTAPPSCTPPLTRFHRLCLW